MLRYAVSFFLLVSLALGLGPAVPADTIGDGFVQVQGDQFALSSDPTRTFKVKGFNYFPQRHPWAIFSEWDPVEVNTEMAIAKAMNGNVIRTFVTGGHHPGQATVNAIVEFVQICKAHNMKAIISLFDGYGVFPGAGTYEESLNFQLIEAVCDALKNDTGVFAWDIKNEPDWIGNEYWSWSLPGAEAEGARRIDWLYRMANKIREVDPNHLVTVGLIFNYNNYLPANTRTVESFVDFVCYHYYPRNYPFETFRQSIQSLKAHTNKPINVEEIGHNAYGGPGATEQDQANLFADWLAVIEDEDISGLVQWTLFDWWDQWPGPIDERYYGFVRYDNYSWKPAAFVYRDYFVVDQFGASQTNGRILGVVRDPNGAPIPSATVTFSPGGYSAKSGSNGEYVIQAIPEGAYTAQASATGFQAHSPGVIQVTAGEDSIVDFTLPWAVPNEVKVINGGFETGDMTGWTGYGQVDGVQSGSWYAGITAHSGIHFLGTAANWGHKNGGAYQQVPVIPGRSYHVQAWSRIYEEGGVPGVVKNRLGIDPTGGTNPASPNVVWSPYSSTSAWEKISLNVYAAVPRITIFLEHFQPESGVWHINAFDDVSIISTVSAGAALRMSDAIALRVEDLVVTGAFGSVFYAQSLDRSAGIGVLSTASVVPGQAVNVEGSLITILGERVIKPTAVEVVGTADVPDPLHMKMRDVGGKINPAMPGIAGSDGLYNTGLLVSVTGRVTYSQSTYCYLDDGSGASDGSGHTGIRVVGTGSAVPEVGAMATATGISARQNIGGSAQRVIRLRDANDLVIH